AGTLVLSGGPGSGKTALVTALAGGGQRLPVGRFHAVHLCRGHVLASTDPIRVLAGIAHRLARSVPGYATSLRRLGHGRWGPDDAFDLVADCPPGVDDVREYLDVAAGLPVDTRAAIAEAAAGCFLYADVARKLAVAAGPGAVSELPKDLDALYHRALADGGE